jgi:hypothetical protein
MGQQKSPVTKRAAGLFNFSHSFNNCSYIALPGRVKAGAAAAFL